MPERNIFDVLAMEDEQEIASIRSFGDESITTGRSIFDVLAYEDRQKVDSSTLWNYIPDFIKRGYNESITGMAQQLATGEAPFDLEDYNPSVLGDIGAGVISFFMPADIAVFAGGAGVGGVAAKKAGK